MHQTLWKEQPISRLTLGTVQFGMPYGIANRTGQVSQREVVRIVAAALESGVRSFDTAAAYGESEEVLGRAFRELNAVDDVFVVTKAPAIQQASQAGQEIRATVADSRQRLGIDCLSAVLFHREEDAVYLEELDQLRHLGWVRHIGVSCGNQPDGAVELARGQVAEVLQTPANLLDRRHLRSGLLEAAQQRQVAVFIRSVFLQGLLLLPDSQLQPDLQDAAGPRRQLEAIAAEAGMSLQELALRFVASLKGVTSAVVGVDRLEQFQSNLDAINRGPLAEDLVERLLTLTWDVSERTITPHMWNNRWQ